MYVPEHAKEERTAVLRDAVERIRFGSLATAGASGIHVTHLPMYLQSTDEGPALFGHIARANPQWREASCNEAVASFLGPHFYVSPRLYDERTRSGRVVPTWNYIAVEVRGPIAFFDEPAGLRSIVETLTSREESAYRQPWTPGDAPEEFIASQLNAIVGFRLNVRDMHGAWKLSRNRGSADRARVLSTCPALEAWDERV